MVNFNSMVFIYKVFNHYQTMCWLKVYDCHQYNTRKNIVNFKTRALLRLERTMNLLEGGEGRMGGEW